jgi:hypothetical protein
MLTNSESPMSSIKVVEAPDGETRTRARGNEAAACCNHHAPVCRWELLMRT